MKLLHVISSVNPEAGGPIEGIKQLAAVHARRGIAVEIATLDDPRDACVSELSVPVHAFGPPRTHYRYVPGLVGWLRAHAADYDAVIVNGLWQYGGFAVWRALRGTRTPYFVFTHGMLDPWFRRTYPLKHMKKWLYWPWGEYRVLRDAAAVFFTCEEERRLASESFWLYRCNEIVVSYGTTAPQGDLDVERAAFFRRYPQLRGCKPVLFLGRIHEKKGCDLLIQAFARVARRDPALRLVIAGPDQTGWQARLTELAVNLDVAHRIVWTGMLHGPAKWGAYGAAEAFILPSHQENFGIVVAEALACRVPVLISNKVNIWREVAEDGAGIVAEDTLEGTISMLEQWLAMTGDDRKRMRANARRCFEKRFEIGRAAQGLVRAVTAHATVFADAPA